MKRIISLMLTLAIFTSVIYPCQSVIAQEVKLNNILSIGRDVAEMCAEYDKYDNLDDTTVSNRLIVKTDTAIDEYGAVDSIYGFGYAFCSTRIISLQKKH